MATVSGPEKLQRQALMPAQIKSLDHIQSQAQRPRIRQSVQDATTKAQGQPSNSSNPGTASKHSNIKTHAHHNNSLGNGSHVQAEGGGIMQRDGTDILSFSRRAAAQLSRVSTPVLVEGDRHLLRDIDRPPPGDPRTRLLQSSRRSLSQVGESSSVEKKSGSVSGAIARKRSQYFEDAFSARNTDTSPAKERVRSEVPVLAEVRTNVIVGDEFTVVTELSAHLALRYRRPLSSVIVTLRHGACMCFGGSFAPAYIMAVSALSAQLQPATNKHNAALIQRHMEESLGVPPARGLLQFVAVPEANLAYGGKTAIGHADDLAKAGTGINMAASNNPNGVHWPPTDSVGSESAELAVDPGCATERRKNRAMRRLSVKSLSSFRAQSPIDYIPPSSAIDEQPPTALAALPAIAERPTDNDTNKMNEASNNKKKREKRSSSPGPGADQKGLGTQEATVMAALVEAPLPVPPPSPVAMGRRFSNRARRSKSFVATLFGRSTTKLEGSSV
ncbi:hypothetical protein SEPCBS57363_006166 [Sporothrix epigloea]|uniref:L-dopachrome isomerase n=1 Tax=Sporothrix epigloea TaxID=1892477 RepID=A0ABP0E1J0_9PEZI